MSVYEYSLYLSGEQKEILLSAWNKYLEMEDPNTMILRTDSKEIKFNIVSRDADLYMIVQDEMTPPDESDIHEGYIYAANGGSVIDRYIPILLAEYTRDTAGVEFTAVRSPTDKYTIWLTDQQSDASKNLISQTRITDSVYEKGDSGMTYFQMSMKAIFHWLLHIKQVISFDDVIISGGGMKKKLNILFSEMKL